MSPAGWTAQGQNVFDSGCEYSTMDTTSQYHVSMGIVGSSLVVVGLRFLLSEPVSLTSVLLTLGGIVVLLAGAVSSLTVDPDESSSGHLTWTAAFCAGICFSGMVLVLLLPVSLSPP